MVMDEDGAAVHAQGTELRFCRYAGVQQEHGGPARPLRSVEVDEVLRRHHLLGAGDAAAAARAHDLRTRSVRSLFRLPLIKSRTNWSATTFCYRR